MNAVSLQLNNTFSLPENKSLGHFPVISPSTPNVNEPAQVPADSKNEMILLEQSDIKASFTYDQELKQVIIVLRSEETGEIVRQFPPEKILKMLAGFAETNGKKVDEKV